MGMLLSRKLARCFSALPPARAALIVFVIRSSVMGCGGDSGQAQPDGAISDGAPSTEIDARVCNIQDLTNGVSTLAGCEVAGAVDGSRTVARFRNPVNVAVGPDGRIYVADF